MSINLPTVNCTPTQYPQEYADCLKALAERIQWRPLGFVAEEVGPTHVNPDTTIRSYRLGGTDCYEELYVLTWYEDGQPRQRLLHSRFGVTIEASPLFWFSRRIMRFLSDGDVTVIRDAFKQLDDQLYEVHGVSPMIA